MADLAAAGLSNRDIADRLVVSVRTVEGHVHRACAKLGVSDRAALAALLRPRPPRGRAPAGPGHRQRRPPLIATLLTCDAVMADAGELRRVALSLEGVEEIESVGFDFRVGGKGFVWSCPERAPGRRRANPR